jgi:hypothetical protein
MRMFSARASLDLKLVLAAVTLSGLLAPAVAQSTSVQNSKASGGKATTQSAPAKATPKAPATPKATAAPKATPTPKELLPKRVLQKLRSRRQRQQPRRSRL